MSKEEFEYFMEDEECKEIATGEPAIIKFMELESDEITALAPEPDATGTP